MEINGIAHTFLTVGDFPTAVGIRASEQQDSQNRFDQNRSGLHHLCFRLRERQDVDELHRFLQTTQARIVHPPQEDGWAPGYYSVLFEDPEGIRLEANFVPGKGLLE